MARRVRVTARLLMAAAIVAASLAWAGAALAHAGYSRSEPGAGAVVSAAPARVDIWFTQDLFRRQGENWIVVTGPDGQDVTSGEAAIDDDDRRHMSVALAGGLAPGDYTVTWRTLSAEDGDDEEDSFTFTLDPQAQATSTPMQPPASATPPPLPTAPPASPEPTAAPAGGGLPCAAALPAIAMAALGLAGARRKVTAAHD